MADEAKVTEPKTKGKSPTKVKVKNGETVFVRSLVKGKPGGGDQVVLWERDERHPNGEAYVAGETVVEVFPTPQVAALIREQKLEEVEAAEE
ncbi:MAG TPA: hypothetical protein PLD20_24415 [Blastocatellia bacterium]|nr:hypothetical protein [Blastocatellia bacterium]HMV87934.1 hypothetical protein [Blastocatellia bacterium]HMX27516.1 hypothetical protein [Blastocatellia bacterium]HMY75192.1 hypothetical protein [Blastocatellia bacterium]HMZ21100.1 hypothetical protein [Blastocatellia bacterium]